MFIQLIGMFNLRGMLVGLLRIGFIWDWKGMFSLFGCY